MNHVILISFLLLSASSAFPCSPGTFSRTPSGLCKPCPKGTYQFLRTLSPIRCTKCPAGTYLPFRRARGLDICQNCPANTFSTTTGAKSITLCKKCPPGTVSAPGSVRCSTPCGDCQILRKEGCQSCYRMLVNGVCTKLRLLNAVCKERSLEVCQPGFGPLRDSCRKCRFGISTNGEKCRNCPLGLVPSSNRTSCIPCTKGQAVEGALCVDCPDGQNTNGSRPLCVDDGTPCPSNFFEDPDGNCNTCVPGERYIKRKKICVECAENERSPGGLTRRCKKCGTNEIGGMRCDCRPGFVRNSGKICTPCPGGTIAGKTGCEECPVGFFSKSASTQCTPCPPGTVQPEKGKSHCKTCANGLIPSTLLGKDYPSTEFSNFDIKFSRFSNDQTTRSDCVDPKTNCPPNLRRVMDGAGRFFCEPQSCPPGSLMTFVKQFGRFRGRVRACFKCSDGKIRRGTRCSRCSQQQIAAGETRCDFCPSFESEIGGRCSCTSSEFHGLFRNASGVCTECLRGTAFQSVQEVRSCPRCARGTVAMDRGSTECVPCAAGTVEKGRVRCERCPDGFTSFGVGDAKCVKIGGNS